MKILLTGSSGFFGRNAMELLSKEHTVFGLARKNAFYNCDLTKSEPEFKEKFNLVLHAASKVHYIPKTDLEKDEFNLVNVVGTLNLLKALSKSHLPKYLVFISSVSVYGLTAGNNIGEDCALMANDAYGKSKIDAELAVLSWCKYNKVVCTILRLPLLFGMDAPGNLGAMIKSIIKGYYFNINGGVAKKSMVLVSDIVKYIPTISEIGGIYNLTDGYHPSFQELSSAIASKFNKKSPSNIPFWLANLLALIGNNFGYYAPINSLKLNKLTSNLTFDDSKARSVFNWSPNPVLKLFEHDR